MRKLRDDIKDLNKWSRCTKRPIKLKCIYRASGTMYCNTLDMSLSVADKSSPILLTDDTGVYWTESVYSFRKNYIKTDDKEIDRNFLREMHKGEFLDVKFRNEESLWSFKVSVDDYRWDCPYGANASGLQHGDGDYLVCTGLEKPDLRTIRLVRNAMFKRFYVERSL